jgi:hypothetical protein
MHQTVQCSTSGSVGDLGLIARVVAENGFDIRAIGGGEAKLPDDGGEFGIVSFLVLPDEEDDLIRLADALENLRLDDRAVDDPERRVLERPRILPGFDVELEHERGALAGVAELLGQTDGGINILSILLVDAHDGWAVASLAFDNETDRDKARDTLSNSDRVRVLPKHGGEHRSDRVSKFVDGKVKRGDKDEGDDNGHGNHPA